MDKLKVGIIGTGNIGTDLLLKIEKSEKLQCTLFMGRRKNSKGIGIAEKMGVPFSTDSIEPLKDRPWICDLVFDATSAQQHMRHTSILQKLGIYQIDLTPARTGKMCVPVLNLDSCTGLPDVNMVTCGGQGAIPIIYAIKNVCQKIAYAEVVATIASKSAGIGTRDNIDEFTKTTKDAIKELCSLSSAKAIITLNPAEPPIHMHNTIYLLIEKPDMEQITKSVLKMEKAVQEYVPGYKVILKPTFENGRVTTMIEVTGAGDYLPPYAGNLDIITSAAIQVAEKYAELGIRRRCTVNDAI